MIRSALVVLLLSLLGCRSTAPGPPVVAANPPAFPPPPGAAGREPDSLLWVRRAAEYRAALLQIYRLAESRIAAASNSRPAGSWAVVLDADETVISNLTYQAERARQGQTFSQDSWHAWVLRREATPLPGAQAFLARVRSLGGRIAIVTNRLQSECNDTEAVFNAHQLAYDTMLCRPDGQPSDKNPRFQAVAAGRSAAGPTPLDVVAFVGDNILDFPGLSQASGAQDAALTEFGVRFFLVPNPMYGSWQ